jgi:hypothetical protein
MPATRKNNFANLGLNTSNVQKFMKHLSRQRKTQVFKQKRVLKALKKWTYGRRPKVFPEVSQGSLRTGPITVKVGRATSSTTVGEKTGPKKGEYFTITTHNKYGPVVSYAGKRSGSPRSPMTPSAWLNIMKSSTE